MSQQPIEFGNRLESGHEVLGGASPQATNVVTDVATGAVLRRPGISAYSEAPSTSIDSGGIDGLHADLDGTLYATGRGTAASTRTLYRITGGSAFTYATPISGPGRAVFAETDALNVFTSGKYLYKVVKSDLSLSRLGGDPPECDYVLANAGRLSANDIVIDRSKIRYSGIAAGTLTFAGLEDWTPGSFATGSFPGFYSAEARPDPVVAILENSNDVFAFGSTNVEVFSPDDTYIYLVSIVREYGLVAKYSVIKVDQAYAWLDHRRRFVFSDGRQFDDSIGQPIQGVLNKMTTVDDCFGYRLHQGFLDCMVWTFPTEGVTFCYQKGAGWSQWQGWDATANSWTNHIVLSHHHRNDTDVPVVGTTRGVVAKYDLEANDDLGSIIPASVTTGFYNRGTERRKKCNAVYVTLARGTSTVATNDPVGFLSYSDSPGKWSTRIPLHLGTADDTDPVIPLYSLGWYRRRQWKFEFSGSEKLSLVSVQEDFDIQDS